MTDGALLGGDGDNDFGDQNDDHIKNNSNERRNQKMKSVIPLKD